MSIDSVPAGAVGKMVVFLISDAWHEGKKSGQRNTSQVKAVDVGDLSPPPVHRERRGLHRKHVFPEVGAA